MRLVRLTAILAAVAATAATCAIAAGGGPAYPGTTQTAVPSRASALMYLARPKPHGGITIVQEMRAGHVTRGVGLAGLYGFPVVTADGSSEGVSHDGRTLVLASSGRFPILDAHTLHVRQVVSLTGNFSYDALSPTGTTLYLIQHVRSCCSNRYYVRAYDLAHRSLIRKPVFDRREHWGLMSGSPISRATSPSGRWVYTLYTRPGGKPFVHSLDAVHRRAFCVDLPWVGSQQRLFRMSLSLKGRKLMLRLGGEGRIVRTIDRRTYRVT